MNQSSVLLSLENQPVQSIQIKGGIYFRTILLQKWNIVPQHTHNHDHATLVISGRIRLWIDDKLNGDFEAGEAIEIKGGFKHVFQALQDNTRLTCIWPESIGNTFD